MSGGDCVICRKIRRLARSPFGVLRRLYRFLFARPSMQAFNDAVLALALHGKGFNNCCDLRFTGEAWFVDTLARMEPRLCLDVGANVGDYSRLLLEQTRARVVAFEPLPATHAHLERLRSAYPDRLTTINKGVGDTIGELPLYHDEAHSGVASFSPEVNAIDFVGAVNTKTVLAPIITLDDFLAGQEGLVEGEGEDGGEGEIDLIKIDVEGYEYEVLVGAEKTIAAGRPKFIQIEYNHHQLFKSRSLYDFSKLVPGYDVFQLLPNARGVRAVDPRRPENNIFIYANYVFARKDLSADFLSRSVRGSA